MCSSHLDPGNGAAHVFEVGRFLSGLTKSLMLLCTALIALHRHDVPFFCICWLDTENDNFCNSQHRIFTLRIVYINMCTKFRYGSMMSGRRSVEMSRSYFSTRCIQVGGFEFRPQVCPHLIAVPPQI